VDIVASAFGLLILSPVFAALALVIKAASPGPVFFTQQRVGLGGKPFSCLKFRTMHTGSDATAHQALTARLVQGDRVMTKLDHMNDPRIIRGGDWIRRSCLDELPQLFNILLGHMSLVGPRPCIHMNSRRTAIASASACASLRADRAVAGERKEPDHVR